MTRILTEIVLGVCIAVVVVITVSTAIIAPAETRLAPSIDLDKYTAFALEDSLWVCRASGQQDAQGKTPMECIPILSGSILLVPNPKPPIRDTKARSY